MKLVDCFMYFDEDLILDIRLNTLKEFVDFLLSVKLQWIMLVIKKN